MYSLSNTISVPTHFTESSSSLIDLCLVTNKIQILLSGVCEPFLDQNIRFHCPIYCVLNLDKTINLEYEREFWLNDKGNYKSLTGEFYNTNWDTLKSNDIDIYTSDITNHIVNTTKSIFIFQIKVIYSTFLQYMVKFQQLGGDQYLTHI